LLFFCNKGKEKMEYNQTKKVKLNGFSFIRAVLFGSSKVYYQCGQRIHLKSGNLHETSISSFAIAVHLLNLPCAGYPGEARLPTADRWNTGSIPPWVWKRG